MLILLNGHVFHLVRVFLPGMVEGERINIEVMKSVVMGGCDEYWVIAQFVVCIALFFEVFTVVGAVFIMGLYVFIMIVGEKLS